MKKLLIISLIFTFNIFGADVVIMQGVYYGKFANIQRCGFVNRYNQYIVRFTADMPKKSIEIDKIEVSDFQDNFSGKITEKLAYDAEVVEELDCLKAKIYYKLISDQYYKK